MPNCTSFGTIWQFLGLFQAFPQFLLGIIIISTQKNPHHGLDFALRPNFLSIFVFHFRIFQSTNSIFQNCWKSVNNSSKLTPMLHNDKIRFKSPPAGVYTSAIFEIFLQFPRNFSHFFRSPPISIQGWPHFKIERGCLESRGISERQGWGCGGCRPPHQTFPCRSAQPCPEGGGLPGQAQRGHSEARCWSYST